MSTSPTHLVIIALTVAAAHGLSAQSSDPPQPEQEVVRQARRASHRARVAGHQAKQQAIEPAEQTNAASRAVGRAPYALGEAALDRRDYERAIRAFDDVINAKIERVDSAMYWKAFALNKLGKQDEALAILAELEKQFPQSRWLSDARASQVEVRAASGQGVVPENQADDELKLLAINSLMNQDPDRAIPLLEKILNDVKNPPNLKSRALFVLAQRPVDKARQILGQYAKGGSNPDLQLAAIQYLGALRSNESVQILAEVYAASTDPVVKRSILRSYMVSGAKDRLVQIAKADQDVGIRGEAIQQLRLMRAGDELAELYGAEADRTLKLKIVLLLGAQESAKHLVDLARRETDPELKREIVRQLSHMNSKEAADYMLELIK